MKNKMELTYTLGQAAEAIQVSRPTMANLVQRADFPSFRVGRRWIIPVDALRRWLDEQAQSYAEERGLSA